MKVFISYESLRVEIPATDNEISIYLCQVFKSNGLKGGTVVKDGVEIIYGTGTNDSIVSVLSALSLLDRLNDNLREKLNYLYELTDQRSDNE